MRKTVKGLAVSTFFILSFGMSVMAQDAATNEVTDVTGRVVEVPADSQNVVMLPGPAYEKAMIVGATDQVGGV